MSNIIDSIQVSGTVYQIQGSGGGNPTVELTQEQYDALVSAGTVSPTTYYIITDAEAVDLDNYYTKSETSGSTQISTALNAKQNTLVAGDNISISGNVISASGGGGATYSAGRGIDITNNTISFNLPISAGTGNGNVVVGDSNNVSSGSYFTYAEGYQTKATGSHGAHAEGYSTTASGQYGAHAEGWNTEARGSRSHSEGESSRAFGNSSHAEGYGTSALTYASHSEGSNTKTSNQSEHASGQYNNSVSASTTFGNSGNTLFSVGNGTANNARHNAFEIRQNGDIYISKDGSDIKLQDNLGGGAASSAITSGDTNAVAGGAVYSKFDEVEQVTAAALNTLNSNFGGLKLVKLTQQEYNALTTKDSNTLYVIV